MIVRLTDINAKKRKLYVYKHDMLTMTFATFNCPIELTAVTSEYY